MQTKVVLDIKKCDEVAALCQLSCILLYRYILCQWMQCSWLEILWVNSKDNLASLAFVLQKWLQGRRSNGLQSQSRALQTYRTDAVALLKLIVCHRCKGL